MYIVGTDAFNYDSSATFMEVLTPDELKKSVFEELVCGLGRIDG